MYRIRVTQGRVGKHWGHVGEEPTGFYPRPYYQRGIEHLETSPQGFGTREEAQAWANGRVDEMVELDRQIAAALAE